jgi:hypothetical protein
MLKVIKMNNKEIKIIIKKPTTKIIMYKIIKMKIKIQTIIWFLYKMVNKEVWLYKIIKRIIIILILVIFNLNEFWS